MLDEGFQSASLSSEISQTSSYNRSTDLEIGNDLSSSVVFSADFQKFDDLKNLLDTSKDAAKLGAMKRIIEMVARGKDCSDLFPAIVKNVVSKNTEIRKLVYAFLTHYAEQEQDIALLSISTFQRALKDPNQLVRASSLRVLSSIRIPLILPIVTLAIQDASKDLSAYVRKTAAHAVLKIYSLDPSEKEILTEIIDRLLSDKTTVVVGSAVRAFEEVCPERLDLMHKNYRKLCNLLMDVDEWGQVVILTMLTRYARTQFPNPEKQLITLENDNSSADGINLSSDPSENSHLKSISSTKDGNNSNCTMIVPDTLTYSISDALPLLEADRNALLNASRYLLHSHNSAVVMASSQLLFYLNAKDDYPAVVRALIHTLHRNREVQYIVLSNIASLTIEHRNLFEPYLRSFFIYSTDSLQVKLLKLEILSSLITETSSSVILREFQHYVNSFDEEFVTATIQAIGRCASTVPQISDVCLGGLLRLMSRPKEKIMGECVIVLRKLLQMKTTDHKEIITHIAQLADTMTIPTALASILWLLGEFSHRVPKIAPDILRKMAKSFSQQEAVVKFQIINLAAKLCIVNPRQTLLLTQYIFNLAKYDVNYDIRDKARFLRGLLFPQIITNPTVIGDDSSLRIPKNELKSNNSNNTFLSKNIRKICLATKPAPIVKSQFEDRSNFRLGTLSHILQRRVSGYCDLTDWPTVPPDPWSRVIVTPLPSLSSAINGSESSDVMNSPKAVSSSHVKHGQNETRKTDRFGNISLNDFFSETEEEDDDDEVDDGSIGNEGQEENGKHKRKLSPFYANDNGSSDDECISSNDEQIEDSKEAFDKDNDESDSDFDLEYLLLGSTMLNHVQEKSTTSSNLSSESQPTGAVPDSSFTTSQDTTTTSGLLKHDFLSEKFSNNELQISMKQDLSSWLNTQSSSSSSDESDHSVLHDTSIEQLVKTSDYNPSKDDRVCTNSPSNAAHTKLDFKGTSEILNKNDVDLSDISALLKYEDNDCTNFPLQAGNYSLPWYTLINPHHESDFTGQLQYARIIWPNHPKLIVISLKLCNQSTHVAFSNIQFDLMNTVMGRLLVDADRIQSFCPIVQLKPQSTSTVNFGIDFAGLCDPIELDLIYESKADSFNSENESSYRWRICLNPPPTELIRPVQLNEKEYFDERAKLILNQSFYHNHLMITSNDNENRCHSEYLCKLKTHLLQNINAQYQFSRIHKISKHLYCNDIELHKNFSSTPSMNVNTSNEYNDDDDNNNNVCITMYITSESISDSHLCLLEISYFPDRLIDRNVHLPIHFSLFCNSSSIFRKNLSLSIENLIKSL